jgi:hypothetical protein
MKLLNFSFVDEPYSVEIRALDCIWDLHNVADFDGFCQDLQSNSVEMKWHINRKYALRDYPADSFGILFKGVEHFEVAPRDPEVPHSEDDCLASVSRVLVGEPLPRNPEDIEGKDFHLLFEFQSGQKIRVCAEVAEFFARRPTV